MRAVKKRLAKTIWFFFFKTCYIKLWFFWLASQKFNPFCIAWFHRSIFLGQHSYMSTLYIQMKFLRCNIFKLTMEVWWNQYCKFYINKMKMHLMIRTGYLHLIYKSKFTYLPLHYFRATLMFFPSIIFFCESKTIFLVILHTLSEQYIWITQQFFVNSE